LNRKNDRPAAKKIHHRRLYRVRPRPNADPGLAQKNTD